MTWFSVISSATYTDDGIPQVLKNLDFTQNAPDGGSEVKSRGGATV